MRLNFYLRGLNKTEDPKPKMNWSANGRNRWTCEKWSSEILPRLLCHPMSLDKDNDAQEAFNMIDYFKRNGVLVKELKEDIGNYKKGDLVIDMAQANVAMLTTFSTRAPTNLPGLLCTQSCWSTSQI